MSLAADRREWRNMGSLFAQAEGVPRLEKARIHGQPYTSRGVLADSGNYYPALKAMIDGLVDAGVFEDDDPSRVVEVCQAGTLRGKDGVVMTIIEVVEVLQS